MSMLNYEEFKIKQCEIQDLKIQQELNEHSLEARKKETAKLIQEALESTVLNPAVRIRGFNCKGNLVTGFSCGNGSIRYPYTYCAVIEPVDFTGDLKKFYFWLKGLGYPVKVIYDSYDTEYYGFISVVIEL